MPENETLPTDSRRATRWDPIKIRLDSGEDPTACLPDIEIEFIQAFLRSRRDWNGNGVSAARMFEAAMKGPEAMMPLVTAVKNHPYAILLRRAVAGASQPTRKQVVQLFLEALWENARDYLQIDRLESGIPNEVRDRMKDVIGSMSDTLGKNPASRLHRNAGKKSPRTIDDKLGESLPRA